LIFVMVQELRPGPRRRCVSSEKTSNLQRLRAHGSLLEMGPALETPPGGRFPCTSLPCFCVAWPNSLDSGWRCPRSTPDRGPNDRLRPAAASIGIELARPGSRVALVDCDLGGANLHTCLGIDPPKRTLSDFVNHQVERIEDVVAPTANPSHGQRLRFIRQLQTLEADLAVLDLAAGTNKNTLDFFLVADQKVLVLGSVEHDDDMWRAAEARLRAVTPWARWIPPSPPRLPAGSIDRGDPPR
jgi:hypothetical protein